MSSLKERFLSYVKIDTQSDPYSSTVPSTAKQIDLSKLLSKELTALKINHELTDEGYIYANIPSNSSNTDVPKIFFCSHIDTAPDCSGTDVKPIVHENYQGGDIVLPDDPSQVISPSKFPELRNKIGHDIIHASGKTLLGADDKCGVATIMEAAQTLVNNPELKHGEIILFFTTDEEIGNGVKHMDLQKLDADFGYTLDSGDVGSFEYENFSANGYVVNITGASEHPGYAKGKMENAIKIASEIIDQLPKDSLSPETTEKKQGFIHPTNVTAELESARLEFLIRDFNTSKLEKHETVIYETARTVLNKYPRSTFEVKSTPQYRNMREVLDKNMHVVKLAKQAMSNLGIKAKIDVIRGGTDGANISHRGIPCPNLFSGQHGIHSKLEWTTIQDMEAAVKTILEICRIAAVKVEE